MSRDIDERVISGERWRAMGLQNFKNGGMVLTFYLMMFALVLAFDDGEHPKATLIWLIISGVFACAGIMTFCVIGYHQNYEGGGTVWHLLECQYAPLREQEPLDGQALIL